MSGQHLVLYGTLGCHLCEIAEQLLLPWVAQGWQIELIDIVDDDDLLQRFSLSIPVLEHVASNNSLAWPFGPESLHDFLSTINSLPAIEVT
ncbi:MAG TPA: glutaredoxin family protein [Pseudomonadales bacterium]|nr:glutaredoxin family protein [Pseudomonadales bacterium]